MKISTLLCLLFIAVSSCSGLRCMPCGTRHPCSDPSTLNCPWGTVKDICNCCDICGKGPNEACGGSWDMYGKCGDCLTCQKETKRGQGICVKDNSKC
ncbi:venom protein 302 [Cherax quadricarinatus]|uniref:venom protein 302 n=1 Tax=Cherax quadricarinatus TaxID=27406 RepID=UPI002379F2E4|nr:venom protein 302-like [Cherax quadricarinatus]